MNQLIMLSKTIIVFLISLSATSGVAWMVSVACQPSNAITPESISVNPKAGTLSAKVISAYPKRPFSSPVYAYANNELMAQDSSVSAFGKDQKKAGHLSDLSSGNILKLVGN